MVREAGKVMRITKLTKHNLKGVLFKARLL